MPAGESKLIIVICEDGRESCRRLAGECGWVADLCRRVIGRCDNAIGCCGRIIDECEGIIRRCGGIRGRLTKKFLSINSIINL
jgi:hypothetical protein